jgi:hypothetical protein
MTVSGVLAFMGLTLHLTGQPSDHVINDRRGPRHGARAELDGLWKNSQADKFEESAALVANAVKNFGEPEKTFSGLATDVFHGHFLFRDE